MESIMFEVEADVDGFIGEIKKHPEIWDSRYETYHDRAKKRSAWVNICAVYCQTFEEKTDCEKNAIYNALIKKWRNLKDTYLKTLKKPKPGTGSKANRPYIHGRQLSFLKETLVSAETECNQDSDDEGRVNEITDASTMAELQQNETSNSSLPSRSDKKNNKKRKIDLESSRIEFIRTPPPLSSNNIISPAPPNPNQLFFDSLVPILDRFTNEELVDFRLDVLTVIKKIQHAWRNNVKFTTTAPPMQGSCPNHERHTPVENPDESNFIKPNTVESYENYDELQDSSSSPMLLVRKRPDTSDPLASTHASKKKTHTVNHRRSQIKDVTEAVKELRELNHAINDQHHGQDECDTFGKHVAAQLRKLSVEECLLAQQEIQNVLTSYRLRDYRKSNTVFTLGQDTINATACFDTINYTPKLATFSPQSAASSSEEVDAIPGSF